MSMVTSKYFRRIFQTKIALQPSAFADSRHRTLTEARKAANKRYIDKFVEVKVRMTPEHRTEVQQHAQEMDESTTAFIKRAIDETIARDKESKKK